MEEAQSNQLKKKKKKKKKFLKYGCNLTNLSEERKGSRGGTEWLGWGVLRETGDDYGQERKDPVGREE